MPPKNIAKSTAKLALAALTDQELRDELKRRDDLVAAERAKEEARKAKEREQARLTIAEKFDLALENLRAVRKLANEHSVKVDHYDFWQPREVLEELDALNLMPYEWRSSSIGC